MKIQEWDSMSRTDMQKLSTYQCATLMNTENLVFCY